MAENSRPPGSETPGAEAGGDEQATAPVLSVGFFIAGVVFVIGLVLIGSDLFGDPDYGQSAGVPINLYWGLVMVAVGVLAGVLTWGSLSRRGRRPTLLGG